MADKYYIDFETKSDLDITKVGAMKYLHTPHSDIICMSWAKNPVHLYGKGEVKLWIPNAKPPFEMRKEDKIYAYNALFEYRVWNTLGRKYGFTSIALRDMVDIQALCLRYTFYANLEQAAPVVGVPIVKNPVGKKLMKKITQPPFKYTDQELRDFYAYCLDDTHVMIGIANTLPMDHLSDLEQKIWEITQRINLRGLPIDESLVKRVWAVVNYYRDKETLKLPGLTGGDVCKVTQTARIVEWVNEQGYDMPNCTADTVKEFIELTTGDVKTVLEMRRDLGRSSIAKYVKLLNQTFKGRIYDNLRYHAASPGRWGGLGFQAHNLPRATVPDIEQEIQKFYDTTILNDNPVYSGMALIRSTITAPEGKALAVADYKAIENRLLAWVAGDERILKLFEEGLDEYIDFATQLFGVGYLEVSKEERATAKPVILGAGYGLAGGGLEEYVKGFGLELDREWCDEAIKIYRTGHPLVTKLWYALKDCAVNAILTPYCNHSYSNCIFRVTKDRCGRKWLTLTIPSGRILVYPDPELQEGRFGLEPTHMGINSRNKKWQRHKLIPGRITENVIQALARDILANGKIELERQDYHTILSVHDEVIVEVGETTAKAALCNITRLICKLPDWAFGLPLDAAGEVMKRYKKI